MHRRNFFSSVAAGTLAAEATSSRGQEQVQRPRSNSAAIDGYAQGLLLGGLIGDALGGPIEFSDRPQSEKQLTDARHWPADRQISAALLDELAASVPLHSYEVLRPEPAAYGPWRTAAPAGTLTDDSRHKMVLLDAIEIANGQSRPVTEQDIAQAFLDFMPVVEAERRDETLALNDEGFREYRYAARWVLGERDLSRALPLERLWAGVHNCSGQMMFLPLAVLYPGEPFDAYLAAYDLDFIDTPLARDITSALVAGLATALSPELAQSSTDVRWQAVLASMRATDPYRYQDVPYAGRQLNKWLEAAESFARRAAGSPSSLYRLLETEGKPEFWWDAHFTLLVPFAMLHLCDFNTLAAMHLCLDFGHDTDSYAQVLGCFAGAVHGVQLFPDAMRTAVADAMREEYARDAVDWLTTLRTNSANLDDL